MVLVNSCSHFLVSFGFFVSKLICTDGQTISCCFFCFFCFCPLSERLNYEATIFTNWGKTLFDTVFSVVFTKFFFSQIFIAAGRERVSRIIFRKTFIFVFRGVSNSSQLTKSMIWYWFYLIICPPELQSLPPYHISNKLFKIHF